MEKRTYKPPLECTEKEAMEAIRNDDIERLIRLPIDLGFNHENWKFIQDVSVRLSEHKNPIIRANSMLGLMYAARFRGRVEKNIVKPVLLKALKDEDPRVSSNAKDAIDDINHSLKWNIGGAKRQKEIEALYEKRRAIQS